MTFHDSLEQALEYAHQAMEQMAQLKIPTTPNNFTVWYTHASGRVPDLTQAIAILKGNNQAFTNAVCHELYEKYFSKESENIALTETATRIESELQRIIAYLGDAGAGANVYGQSLATARNDISTAKDALGLKDALAKILNETQKMQAINKTLETKLAASTQEIGQLRDDLEDMRKEALTDALTGIPNRKQFDMELRQKVRDAMENGAPVSLLLIDIDHFKAFNDRFGHQTGDEVLKLLAATLVQTVKGGDVPARYGGEEFAVILPKTALAGAIKVAQDIRGQVALKRLINRNTGQDLGKITVSVGVGQLVLGEALSELVKRTDQALYKAKSEGRNRVVGQDELRQDELSFH